MKVRLLRARCFGGERIEAGTELDLADRNLIREMLHLGLAVEVGEKLPPQSGPMTTESVTAVVKGKAPRRGVEDAGK